MKTILFEIDRPGPGHHHKLMVLDVQFPDCSEAYIEVYEPKGCGCKRRIALTELVHLLLNVTEEELLAIPNRDADAVGHPHLGLTPI